MCLDLETQIENLEELDHRSVEDLKDLENLEELDDETLENLEELVL